MSNLQEFLKKQAEQERGDSDRRQAVLQDWLRALHELIGQMKGWLLEADTEHVLKITDEPVSIRERPFGTYTAPGLEVALGTRVISIRPVARYSIGSFVGDALGTTIRHGRVDMSNVESRFLLYRRIEDGQDRWIMVDDSTYRPQTLDRSSFEAAVQGMLE